MKDLNFLKKVGKGAGILLFGILLSKVFAYVFRVIVARSFGASDYGLLILAIAIVSFVASTAVFGLPQGLLRYIAYYLGKGDERVVAPMIGSVLKVVFPISLFFGIVTFVFAGELSTVFFHKPELILFLKITAFLIPLLVLYNVFDYVLQAFQDAKSLVVSRNLADPLAKVTLLSLVVWFGLGVWGAAFAYVGGVAVAVAVMLLFLRKKVKNFSFVFLKPARLDRELVSYSWPLLFTNFSLMIFSWADVIMLGIFVPSASVGVYDAASVTSRLLSIVPLALSTMFMPAVTEVFAKNESHVARLYRHVSKWVLMLLLPMLVFLAVFSRTILGSFFGSEFSAGAVSLIVLLFGQLFWGWSLVSSNILAMLKKTKLVFFLSASAALINIVLNIVLIPRIGILGAAVATSFSLVFVAVLQMFLASRELKTVPFGYDVIKLLVSIAIPVGILVLFFRGFIVDIPLIYAIGIGFLFSLAYLILLFITKSFDSDDKELFDLALKKYNPLKKS